MLDLTQEGEVRMIQKAAVVLLGMLLLGTSMVQGEAAAQTDNKAAATVQEASPAPERKAIKIVQTAGRQQFGDFAPDFARYNDDILFGEVWSKNDVLSLHDRSIVTVSALIAQGITDSSLKYHIESAKKNGVTKAEMAEIITQVGFYGGWPKAWAAFRYAKDVYQEPVAK